MRFDPFREIEELTQRMDRAFGQPAAPARFAPPDISAPGDHHATALLRDALVAGQTTGAGPLRGFARLGFNPRAYQLVPLLVALRMHPVRLLLADDVGLGQTAEADALQQELSAAGFKPPAPK